MIYRSFWFSCDDFSKIFIFCFLSLSRRSFLTVFMDNLAICFFSFVVFFLKYLSINYMQILFRVGKKSLGTDEIKFYVVF